MSRKNYRNTRIIVIFVVLLALAWAFYKIGLPFERPESRGAKSIANLQDELMYRWDDAKKSNYNAKFQIVMESKNFDNIADSLGFLSQYVEKYRGTILSKYEFMIRVPVSETKEFSHRVKSLANLVRFSSDYSTALNIGSIEAYNDSLVTLQAQRKNYEKLRRENPNIKGYTQDIAEIDGHIGRIIGMKQSLQNTEYDLYLIAFSEQFQQGVSTASYVRALAKQFIIALVALALGVPLLVLGSRLLFKVLGIVGTSTSQLYGSYYNKSYKYGGDTGYGYNYGRKRHVKRVYKDKPSGDNKNDGDSSDKS